jgi:hypothetical protein
VQGVGVLCQCLAKACGDRRLANAALLVADDDAAGDLGAFDFWSGVGVEPQLDGLG